MTARSDATVPVFSHLGLAPRRTRETSRWTAIAPYALWTVQIAFALLFVFAGGMKFVMSAHDLTKNTALSAMFLRFIGVCEVLGAIGLVGPALAGKLRFLTPLAAGGLVIIMIGATVVTTVEMSAADAIFPFAVGLLLALVLYSRRTWLSSVPTRPARRTR